VVDRRRYASHARFGARAVKERPRGLDQLYRGRAASTFKDLYETDHAEGRQGGRFRWLVSTCLAGMVGAISIFVVIYGSVDERQAKGGFLETFSELSEADLGGRGAFLRPNEGLKWATPKADRLKVTSGAKTVRYRINEPLKQQRGGREYIDAKPYVRIVGRLAPVPTNEEKNIPVFNPLKLYATEADTGGTSEKTGPSGMGNIAVNVVELLGGIMPIEDGIELDDAEIALHVKIAQDAEAEAERVRAGAEAEMSDAYGDTGAIGPDGIAEAAANTTVLTKPVQEAEDTLADLEGRETLVVKVGPQDSLRRILVRAGADSWQARGMIDAARKIFPESRLEPGQEVRITLVPSLTQKDRKEPARFSVFSSGHGHLVSVMRNAAGEFVASKSPSLEPEIANASLGDSDRASSTSSVYASVYQVGLLEQVPEDTIWKIMKIHAYETDFRRRLSPGDEVEFFFDMKNDPRPDATPGELLFTSITTGGETYRFYRFRTSDGEVDYYDEKGNNSKKFLMRQPVRGENVRLTSGFGLRVHPLLNEKRMHTGVDWATSPGTPILAAGSGVIEVAGRKGQYGNYIRIRHPNGYHTAYAHMLRFRKGIVAGAKVRQGEVIGYVGTTGLSSGPHLHYEVLINSRRIDPLSMDVPRERQLRGRQLAEFQKERARIDELRHMAPVMTASK
jgi:murein DD-endopeptidase MepM/ murein hydrolase activator NlpD